VLRDNALLCNFVGSSGEGRVPRACPPPTARVPRTRTTKMGGTSRRQIVSHEFWRPGHGNPRCRKEVRTLPATEFWHRFPLDDGMEGGGFAVVRSRQPGQNLAHRPAFPATEAASHQVSRRSQMDLSVFNPRAYGSRTRRPPPYVQTPWSPHSTQQPHCGDSAKPPPRPALRWSNHVPRTGREPRRRAPVGPTPPVRRALRWGHPVTPTRHISAPASPPCANRAASCEPPPARAAAVHRPKLACPNPPPGRSARRPAVVGVGEGGPVPANIRGETPMCKIGPVAAGGAHGRCNGSRRSPAGSAVVPPAAPKRASEGAATAARPPHDASTKRHWEGEAGGGLSCPATYDWAART